MNPFDLGMMGLTGFSDPGSFADMMTQMGMMPPGQAPAGGGANQFGSIPSMFGLGDPGGGLGGQLMPLGGPPATTEGWGATVTPEGAGAPGPAGGILANLAKMGMQGVKSPAPVQPIMSGGVSGGAPVHPAQASATAHQSNVQSALMALLAAHANPTPRVPSLGALIHGGA